MSRQKIALILGIPLIGSLCLMTGCAHKGLYRAIKILGEEGAIPRSMKLLTPVNAEVPLGVSVRQTADSSKSNAIELDPTRCFWLPDASSNSLSKIEFEDKSAQTLNTTIGVANIAAVGLKFKSVKSVKGTFKDVRYHSGLGVFDENRCEAVADKDYFVVSSGLSGLLELTTTAVLEAAPTAKVQIPNTPIDVQVEQGTATQRTVSFAATTPVFFAVATDRVKIKKSSTADEAIPLSSSKTVQFPQGFAGDVNLKPFDTGNNRVTLTISPATSVASKPPPDFVGTTCALAAEMTLEAGKGCYIWLDNAAIVLKVFIKDTVPSVRLDAYRTSKVEGL